MQTPHLTHGDSKGIWVNSFPPFVGRKSFIPPLQFFEPGLLELHVTISLGFAEDTNGSIRLLQLVIDSDQCLHCSRVLILFEFKFLVMESFGKCMAFRGIFAQRANVNWKCLVIMFHELG